MKKEWNEGNYVVYTDEDVEKISLISIGESITIVRGNLFDIAVDIANLLEVQATSFIAESETLTAIYELNINIEGTDVMCIIETSHTSVESLSLSYYIDGNEACFEDDYVFIVKMCDEYLRDVYNSWKSDNYLAFNRNMVDDSCKYSQDAE